MPHLAVTESNVHDKNVLFFLLLNLFQAFGHSLKDNSNASDTFHFTNIKNASGSFIQYVLQKANAEKEKSLEDQMRFWDCSFVFSSYNEVKFESVFIKAVLFLY